jgi:hypothetical protein
MSASRPPDRSALLLEPPRLPAFAADAQKRHEFERLLAWHFGRNIIEQRAPTKLDVPWGHLVAGCFILVVALSAITEVSSIGDRLTHPVVIVAVLLLLALLPRIWEWWSFPRRARDIADGLRGQLDEYCRSALAVCEWRNEVAVRLAEMDPLVVGRLLGDRLSARDRYGIGCEAKLLPPMVGIACRFELTVYSRFDWHGHPDMHISYRKGHGPPASYVASVDTLVCTVERRCEAESLAGRPWTSGCKSASPSQCFLLERAGERERQQALVLGVMVHQPDATATALCGAGLLAESYPWHLATGPGPSSRTRGGHFVEVGVPSLFAQVVLGRIDVSHLAWLAEGAHVEAPKGFKLFR